jgi:hypothetical protein
MSIFSLPKLVGNIKIKFWLSAKNIPNKCKKLFGLMPKAYSLKDE